MKNKINLVLVTIIILFQHDSCKPTIIPAANSVKVANTTEAPVPNSCFITGKILQIISPDGQEDSGTVCAKTPCHAWVEIKNIAGCGSGLLSPMNPGDSVMVFFVFSLAPTEKVNPAIHPAYPGLKAGNMFRALVEQRLQPGNTVAYRINGYEVVKM